MYSLFTGTYFPHTHTKYRCHDLWNTNFNIPFGFFWFFAAWHLNLNSTNNLQNSNLLPWIIPSCFLHSWQHTIFCLVTMCAQMGAPSPLWERPSLRAPLKPIQEAGWHRQSWLCRQARMPPPFSIFAAFLFLGRFRFCWVQCFAQQVSYSSLNSF